jgi:phosphatidylethanolamine/phosphatidyl-N-methylethanolamine N-methyltransferase
MEEAATGRVRGDLRRVERVYDALSTVYDSAFDWVLGPGREKAVQALEAQPGDRILEVGVGTGLTLPLYPEHCRITGIDISAEMLERARARREDLGLDGVELRVMDAGQLDFPDGAFDRVLAPYVVSVVPDPVVVMNEARRVCRPGGRIVVVNHFGSQNRAVSAVESLFSPASQWLGFRLDLPSSIVRALPGLRLVRETRVNLFGLWRLMVFERVAS